MKIEILGPGCRNCDALYDNVIKALEKAELTDTVQVEKIKDINYFVKMGVFSTPGLVVDGEVISTGKALKPEQILGKLKEKGITLKD